MGNCVRKESSTEWGGEDWGSLSPASPQKQFGEDKEPFGKHGAEIKVKISKKQLAELVGKADDLRGFSIDQFLAELKNGADRYETHLHRSWRPALHSIPEVN